MFRLATVTKGVGAVLVMVAESVMMSSTVLVDVVVTSNVAVVPISIVEVASTSMVEVSMMSSVEVATTSNVFVAVASSTAVDEMKNVAVMVIVLGNISIGLICRILPFSTYVVAGVTVVAKYDEQSAAPWRVA